MRFELTHNHQNNQRKPLLINIAGIEVFHICMPEFQLNKLAGGVFQHLLELQKRHRTIKMPFLTTSLFRPLCAGLLLTASTGWSTAQESLLKAEALVRVQSIPISKVMNFEQAYSAEQLEFAAWLSVLALDSSSAWGPKNRGWNLYRVNMRIDMEEKLRSRWQSSSGTIRSLSQNPDTSLAKFWADALAPAEIDELLVFYESPAGKKFLAYQNDLRRAYYRGKLAFEEFKFDPSFVGTNPSIANQQSAWLSRHNMPPESSTQTYAFHAQSLQRIFPSTAIAELIFNLAVGAVPGTPAMDRLNNSLNESERETIRTFLKSPVSTKELAATKAWQETINKSRDLMPLLIGDIRSHLDLVSSWQKIRSDPESLPRSIAIIDPSSVAIPDTLNPERLEDSGLERYKKCLPTVSDRSVQDMERFIQSKDFLKASRITVIPASRAMYVTRGSYGACIHTTVAGYPILGVDSFANSVYVVGMTETENQDWFRRVAQEVTANGSSNSLLISPNGNAFEISYAIDARQAGQLIYKIKFMLSGTYKPTDYRVVIKPTVFKSISTVSSIGPTGAPRLSKSILSSPEDLKRAADDAKRNAG